MTAAGPPPRLGAAERALLAGAGAVVLALVVVAVAWLPALTAMYRDLGGELPGLSRLVLSRRWPLAVGGIVAVGAAGAAALPRPRGLRLGLLAGLVAFGVLAIVATVVGAYLPIYELSSAIRAD